jgi:hypothetical protein
MEKQNQSFELPEPRMSLGEQNGVLQDMQAGHRRRLVENGAMDIILREAGYMEGLEDLNHVALIRTRSRNEFNEPILIQGAVCWISYENSNGEINSRTAQVPLAIIDGAMGVILYPSGVDTEMHEDIEQMFEELDSAQELSLLPNLSYNRMEIVNPDTNRPYLAPLNSGLFDAH